MRPDRQHRVASFAAVALTWALGLLDLGRRALWIDEADSVYFAAQSVRTLLTALCDPHPPGYYLLLKGWLAGGRSEVWVRIPSVAVAILTVALTMRLGRSLGASAPRRAGRSLGVLGGGLLAVSPLHLWYAREARMYATVTALGILAVILARRYARSSHGSSGVGYGIVAMAALFVDQSAFLPLLVANLLWLAHWISHRSKEQLLRWGVMQVLILAGFVGWRLRSPYPPGGGTETFYQITMLMRVLQRVGLDLARDHVLWATLVLLGGGAIMGTALYVTALIRRWPASLGREVWYGVAILFALVTVGTAVPRLFTVKRFLVTVWPYGVLLAAYALLRLRAPAWLLGAGILLAGGLALGSILTVPAGQWSTAVARMAPRLAPGDVIWVDELAVPVFDYYYEGSQPRAVLRASQLPRFAAAWREAGADQRLWVVVAADAYRDLLDYLAPAVAEAQVWADDRPGIKVRAYQPARLAPDVSPLADREPPRWLVRWPSPLDPACASE
jgi:hypothetical protein